MRFFLGLWLGALVMGSGCSSAGFDVPVRRVEVLPRPTSVIHEKREMVEAGMEMVRAAAGTSTQGEIVLAGFDQEKFGFLLTATGTRLNMEDWQEAFPRSVAGVNGVYFREDFSPAGFFVAPGVAQTKRRFDVDSSALIVIDDRLRIVDTRVEKVDWARVRQGAQTYPVLIREGVLALTRDTGKLARRTFIGVDKKGWVWMGALADDQVSLYALARRLMELGIDWDIVVNLDGGPSTGMFVRTDDVRVRRETFGGVPNVVLVEMREAGR